MLHLSFHFQCRKKAEKVQKLKEKQAWKKEKKASGFEHLTDTVKFGDVVHAPPNLTAKPRKSEGKTNRVIIYLVYQ